MPLPDVPPQPPLAYAVPVAVLLSTERVTVAPSTRMGMTGLHYLRPVTPQLYGGVSVFAATQGDRGGFFGWGLSGGYRLREGPWQAEAGLFVGGAGGSPGWVGGGLMLRPHASVSGQWGRLTAGLGVSQVWFPNGQVRSTQPYATLGWTDDVLFGPAGGGESFRAADGAANRATTGATRGAATAALWSSDWAATHALPTETAAAVGRYSLTTSARRDGSGSAPPLQYGGLVLRRALPLQLGVAQPYWMLGVAGGLTAAYAGYAELLGGVGLQAGLPWGLPLSGRVEAALGSGGAGTALDTGGGLLRKLSAGLTWQVLPQLGLTASVGRVSSSGPFKAQEARLELAWRGWDIVPGEASGLLPAPGTVAWAPWSFSAGEAWYARMRRDDRSGGEQPSLGLAALKLERELGPHWRVLGQAGIATHGGAGGYATGQLGLGWLTARRADTGWRLGAEASVGAAGGGAVQVGGGLIGQAQLQARYSLTPQWSVQADAGWLRSRHGALSSPLLGLSAVVSFSRLQGS